MFSHDFPMVYLQVAPQHAHRRDVRGGLRSQPDGARQHGRDLRAGEGGDETEISHIQGLQV